MALLVTSANKKPETSSASAGDGALPPHVLKALGKITELNSLPEITTRIVEVVEDPRATAHDMHEIVKNDPALATKILKVVNSAFYGLPAQIGSLDRAIVMLGLSAVKNIALAASLARLFKPGSISEQFTARDLWRHCIAVGVCGRQITKASAGMQNDEAFVAGLVHDLGLLIEYQVFPEELKTIINRCQTEELPFGQIEREVLQAEHQQLGDHLSAKWKFPPTLRTVISHHHNPSGLRPEFQKLTTVVHIADTLCCQQQCGFYLTAAHQTVAPDALALIGVTTEQLEGIVADLPEQIEEAERVFSEG